MHVHLWILHVLRLKKILRGRGLGSKYPWEYQHLSSLKGYRQMSRIRLHRRCNCTPTAGWDQFLREQQLCSALKEKIQQRLKNHKSIPTRLNKLAREMRTYLNLISVPPYECWLKIRVRSACLCDIRVSMPGGILESVYNEPPQVHDCSALVEQYAARANWVKGARPPSCEAVSCVTLRLCNATGLA